jgi:hypothetical protein
MLVIPDLIQTGTGTVCVVNPVLSFNRHFVPIILDSSFRWNDEILWISVFTGIGGMIVSPRIQNPRQMNRLLSATPPIDLSFHVHQTGVVHTCDVFRFAVCKLVYPSRSDAARKLRVFRAESTAKSAAFTIIRLFNQAQTLDISQ